MFQKKRKLDDSFKLYFPQRTFTGGAARISAQIKKFKADAEIEGTNVLVTHSGDALTGTLFYTIYGAEADAAYMNSIRFDAFVPGNHEFDDGDEALADLSRRLRTPVISSNCKYGESIQYIFSALILVNLMVAYQYFVCFDSTSWITFAFKRP